MLIFVSDTSVLIDIENGGLIDKLFELPYQFIVPDILFAEELSKKHFHMLDLGLQICELDGSLVRRAFLLKQKHRRLSVDDLLGLVLAEQKKCSLLTGDRALRRVALEYGLDVHGTIWMPEYEIEVMIRSFVDNIMLTDEMVV